MWGGRLRVRGRGVWGESRAKEEVSRIKAEAERAREMTREEIKKLREEEDRIIGEKFEREVKRGEVGSVIVVEREEVEELREEREVLELDLKMLGKIKKCKEGEILLKALLEEKESRERKDVEGRRKMKEAKSCWRRT
jgi:hypothetical protein